VETFPAPENDRGGRDDMQAGWVATRVPAGRAVDQGAMPGKLPGRKIHTRSSKRQLVGRERAISDLLTTWQSHVLKPSTALRRRADVENPDPERLHP